ncbi:MAG TPA: ABC transporter permease [Gemmataceae bacterium]|nr:ABC transporter permease [Gemmataceae bacterium]
MLGPIFAREWLTLPRRPRHYLARSFYLLVLWVLALTAWQITVGWEQPATLGDTARFGLFLFQVFVCVQLALLLFFSALSAASTIAQEKDRRTFILLLLTDLRNYEIVLGKLLGSLLQILLLLAGMVPILFLNVLLGGVAPFQVLQATVVLATTAVAAGSLGGLIALWRDKTFQALALTVLFLVLYFCLVHALALLPQYVSGITQDEVDQWQSRLLPYVALQEVLEPPEVAPAIPVAYGFAIAMGVLSVLLNGLGILKLRSWNPRGEPIMQRERPEDEEIDRAKAHAAPGKVRTVWANPILWREIATRAYGRRTLLVKFAYLLVVVLVGYFALGPAQPGEWAAAKGLVPIGILSLVLVSAQAVTAITSERDLGALDLLLVTDLTPKEFIFGKLWGILYNTWVYIVPPLVLVGIYAWRGLLASPPEFGRNLEAFICVAGGAIILLGFTIVLGVHVALGTQNSRLAVINTLGTVFFLSVGTLICIYLILINGRFEYQWLSFSGFIFAGIGGLWWVLSGDRPSAALTLAAWFCPFAVFYSVTNILIGKPGLRESTDPFVPFLVTGGAFAFTIAAMLVPLLSEFDVALGRTSAAGE